MPWQMVPNRCPPLNSPTSDSLLRMNSPGDQVATEKRRRVVVDVRFVSQVISSSNFETNLTFRLC